MSRHLIVIEGTDGSGKSTQAQLTYDAIVAAGADVKRLTFPRYQDESSMLVRMYLRGDFGTHPEDVNPYAASTFYAADRYASFKTDWQQDWEKGRVIFCDRYTTSNAVHQSSKLPEDQLEPFTEWLFDYEYNLLGLYRKRNYPTDAFWQIAAEVGNPVILGVDAHQAEALHRPETEAQARAYLASLGITPIDTIDLVPIV